jgi:hypothetical protein
MKHGSATLRIATGSGSGVFHPILDPVLSLGFNSAWAVPDPGDKPEARLASGQV